MASLTATENDLLEEMHDQRREVTSSLSSLPMHVHNQNWVLARIESARLAAACAKLEALVFVGRLLDAEPS